MAFLTGMDDDSSKEEFKLLYTTICEHAPPVEHEEIKRVLGREVVEENELLLQEYRSLLEIAEEFEYETDAIHAKHQEAQKLLIPDRNRLLHNIKFFLDNINRAATPTGRPRTGPLPVASTPREQAVVDYVAAELELPSSPTSRLPGSPVMPVAGSLRPRSASTSSSGRNGRPLTAPGGSSAAAAKVRALDMESTKGELRQIVQGEHDTLMQQVELARLRIEDAAEFRLRVVEAPMPSVKEIKDFQHKLENMSMAPQHSLLDTIDMVDQTEKKSPRKAHRIQSMVADQLNNPTSPGALSPTPPPKLPKRKALRVEGAKKQGGPSSQQGRPPSRTSKAISIDCSAAAPTSNSS